MIAAFADALFDLYTLVLIARVILSWLPVDPLNPVVQFLRGVTEPVLAPIRSVLPDTGGIDFSPLVALLALQVARSLVMGLIG